MDAGESLTRTTVWLALALYVAGELVQSLRWNRTARVLNTAGCLAFITHVGCAFHFYHHWSHASAYAETARQTAEYFGVNWGGGLYFNYAFLVLWIVHAIRSWTKPAGSRPPVRWILWFTRGFILMMIFNGAVVFARGPIRWFGLLLCGGLVASWGLQARRRIMAAPSLPVVDR